MIVEPKLHVRIVPGDRDIWSAVRTGLLYTLAVIGYALAAWLIASGLRGLGM